MYKESFWSNVRKMVSDSKRLSILFFTLTLIIGMATAAFVNYISTSPQFAKAFYLGTTVAVVSIVISIFIFQPFFTFRFKYKFLDQYEKKKAKYFFSLFAHSKSWVNSTDGLIGIRLFEVQKHTLLKDRLFEFKLIFDAHYKKSKLDNLKPQKITLPITLDKWIKENIHNESGSFTITQHEKNKLDQMNLKTITKQLLIFYVMKYLEKRFPEHSPGQIKEILLMMFGKDIEKELGSKDFKSIHYSSIFQSFEDHLYHLDHQNSPFEFVENSEDNVFYYTETYANPQKQKSHRKYYNFHFKVASKEEGMSNIVLQVIIDERIIPTDKNVLHIVNNII